MTLTEEDWKKKNLPDKLSAMILLALEDLEKVEKDPNYIINMHRWHEPVYKEVNRITDEDTVTGCMVCLAGSVLSKSLDFAINENYKDLIADEFITERMEAFDDCRNGDFDDALVRITEMDESRAWKIQRNIDTLIKNTYPKMESRWVDYEDDCNLFKSNLRLAAAYLESEGY